MADDETPPPMATASKGLHLDQKVLLNGLLALGMLAVSGFAGGKIAGFRVEPEECDECGKGLAACEARQDLIVEALKEAKEAIKIMREECTP